MSAPQVQVQRAGADSWEITEVRRLSVGANTWEYEKLGRIFLDAPPLGDGRYRVDVPLWQEPGFAWHRLEVAENTRGWLTYSGALHWLLDRRRRAS